MSKREFIRKNRKEIDEYIRSVCNNCKLSDDERWEWVMNDELLYNWARREGVAV